MENHHAILLLGSSLEKVGIDLKQLRLKTEVDFIEIPTLSIGEVRKVIASAYGRPFELETKTILIKAEQIAIEAQNALLKILEEPPATTKFILILPSEAGLLPTLLSRLSLQSAIDSNLIVNEKFLQFLSLNVGERINLIADIAKNKDSEQFNLLYTGLITWLLKNSHHPSLSEIHWCLNNLNMRGASKKMLWEEIALSI